MSTNIMIVDDEKDIADLVQIYLENDGFNVFKFYNAKDALECECTKILTWQYSMLCCLILTVFHYVNRYEKNISFQSSC